MKKQTFRSIMLGKIASLVPFSTDSKVPSGWRA
jgi:hypothetical protein